MCIYIYIYLYILMCFFALHLVDDNIEHIAHTLNKQSYIVLIKTNNALPGVQTARLCIKTTAGARNSRDLSE